MDDRFKCSYEKRCAFCNSEDLFPLDYVGTGITYICRACLKYTFWQPKPSPFPWDGFVVTLMLVAFAIYYAIFW